MALVQCPKCDNQVSSHAPACPQCGFVAASAQQAEVLPPQQTVQSVQVAAPKQRTFLDVSPVVAFFAVVVFGGFFAVLILDGMK